MTYPPLPTRLLRVSLALILVAVACWYSPLVTAGLWHLFHPGGWVSYRGLRIRVPWPWIADTELDSADPTVAPQGLALKKSPTTANRLSAGQLIFVTVISPDPGTTAEQQTSEWMRSFRETHPGRAFSDRTPVALPSGASCLQARSRQQNKEEVWTCISVENGWVSNFEGRPGEETAFFEIVRNLKRESKSGIGLM
jgi:hypothetical protein